MSNDKVDFSVFDPAADEIRWERRIRSILGAAETELARRRATRSPMALVGAWARPLLAAAAVLAMVSGSALLLAERAVAVSPGPGPEVAESLRLPETVADWLTVDREPTASDLMLALEGDWQ